MFILDICTYMYIHTSILIYFVFTVKEIFIFKAPSSHPHFFCWSHDLLVTYNICMYICMHT